VASEKRVVFRSEWLPWVLLAPQVAVIAVFFFWPAGQALLQSFQQSDAFGSYTEWVGLENFHRLFSDPTYLASFKTTALFSVLVAGLGIAISLLLAVFADRVVRGTTIYRTLLIWPYAVAPAVAGVLWLFMFAPSIGIVSHTLRSFGVEWNHLLNSGQAMALIVAAAVWKQISYNFLFFLAGLQSIPKSLVEAAAIDGARALAALLDHPVSAAVADDLLPLRHQHRLRLLRHLRHRRCGHPGRPGQGHRHPGLQGLLRRLQGDGPGRLGGTVGGADGDRDRTDGGAVPLRREEGQLLNRATHG
jgi:ABC-type spermidine/putrescine transport system permease subunit I